MQIVSPQLSDFRPPRIEPLACLPVFFTLTDERVVVAGGSDAAGWKAELLAAAGARVEVYAPTASRAADLVDLARRGASAGSVTLLDCTWRPEHLIGAALAVADIEDGAEAAQFVAAATAAGVPYNVIDKPQFCQFQFGGIVNRSPIVVGISTVGAAPILGQAVRQRIEILLPKTLARWGQMARDIRATVMTRLKPGLQRRAFWQKLSELAFRSAPGDQFDALDLINEVTGHSAPVGRVTLVGAGPGDADLLTVKALRALQSADVILFDDLVSAEVLELARREAKRMLVGKRGGRDSCRQEDINDLMVSLARRGKHVVRLKSGDPMIFGRGGEEVTMLDAAGIAVEVVPGITAALALSSRLGVSLTHRNHAQSVRFVTGHARTGRLPDGLDWRGLSDPATTTVFYMSRRTLPQIAERLLGSGLTGATAAVIAANLGRADERIWRGSLGEAAAALASFATTDALLFAVGDALGVRKVQRHEGLGPPQSWHADRFYRGAGTRAIVPAPMVLTARAGSAG